MGFFQMKFSEFSDAMDEMKNTFETKTNVILYTLVVIVFIFFNPLDVIATPLAMIIGYFVVFTIQWYLLIVYGSKLAMYLKRKFGDND